MMAAVVIIWAVLSYVWMRGVVAYLDVNGYQSGDFEAEHYWAAFGPPAAALVLICAKLIGII